MTAILHALQAKTRSVEASFNTNVNAVKGWSGVGVAPTQIAMTDNASAALTTNAFQHSHRLHLVNTTTNVLRDYAQLIVAVTQSIAISAPKTTK